MNKRKPETMTVEREIKEKYETERISNYHSSGQKMLVITGIKD